MRGFHATLLYMKSTLRTALLHQRLTLPSDQKQIWDTSLQNQLQTHPSFIHAHTIGLFHPIQNEPDLLAIISLYPDKHFLLPVVHGNSMHFHTFVFEGNKTSLIKSSLHILEPMAGPLFEGRLDLLVAPGLGFTSSGHRLGFGKGFFDVYLKENRPKAVLGVLYPFQLLKELPVDAHDERVDGLVVANSD